MKKTLMITIMVDDVPLEDLSTLDIELDELFIAYEDKRIIIQIQDEPMVKRPS